MDCVTDVSGNVSVALPSMLDQRAFIIMCVLNLNEGLTRGTGFESLGAVSLSWAWALLYTGATRDSFSDEDGLNLC